MDFLTNCLKPVKWDLETYGKKNPSQKTIQNAYNLAMYTEVM